MKDFTILMYEDDSKWKAGFEYAISGKMAKEGRELKIIHREDSDTIEQDLMICLPDLIMVDHDLGEETGDEIIASLEGVPELVSTSIYYYSEGESLDDLRGTAQRFNCQIQCFAKTGDSLEISILKLI